MIYEVAAVVSLGLTPSTLVLAASVLWTWRRALWASIRSGMHTPMESFVAGLVVPFAGQISVNRLCGHA